jgi:hypothetical protein
VNGDGHKCVPNKDGADFSPVLESDHTMAPAGSRLWGFETKSATPLKELIAWGSSTKRTAMGRIGVGLGDRMSSRRWHPIKRRPQPAPPRWGQRRERNSVRVVLTSEKGSSMLAIYAAAVTFVVLGAVIGGSAVLDAIKRSKTKV